MNILIVGEGEVGESEVYKKWVPFVNPNLTYVDHISKIVDNNFTFISGFGYPFYYQVIEDAINDINTYNNIQRLVIAVDSETLSYQEKYDEMNNFILDKKCLAAYYIVIQHFCLETWALGNRNIIGRNIKDSELRAYLNFFNVSIDDPELLPQKDDEELNRAQFAEKYLRKILNNKYRNLTYKKSKPTALLNLKFFTRVSSRYIETCHISSFNYFLQAFL